MRDVRDILAFELRDRCFMQAAVAKKAGLTEQQLSDVVKKRRKLDANEMFSICKVIGVTPDALFAAAQDSA